MSRLSAPSGHDKLSRDLHRALPRALVVPLLALALVIGAMLMPTPAPAQSNQADRFMAACMAAEQNQSYCRCTTDMFLQGLTPEEMTMFLTYLETENEQDSAFLEAMLPQEKIGAIFEQADATCYGDKLPPASNQIQGNAKQRMLKQCLDAGDDPAYCQCAVERIAPQLNEQELDLVVLYMEEQDPNRAEQYLSKFDSEKVDAIFSEADQHCQSATLPPTDYKPTSGDAVERFVSVCVAEEETPASCRCFAEHFAERASDTEIHMILDALEAEDAGDFDRSDWIYNQMDQQKLDAAFDYASKACNLDL